MAYFTAEFINFFKTLDKNNNKEWFEQNRKLYEKEVKKPFSDFTQHIINLIQKQDPEVQIKAADAVSRINKDIRFSKDKTPYNTHFAANISKYGRKSKEYPGFYFQLGHDKAFLVGGIYMPEKENLYKIREYIAAHGDEFNKLLNDKNFKEKFGELQGEKSKILPAELKEAATKNPLIYNKQFYYSANLPSSEITKENFDKLLMEYYTASKGVLGFLKRAIEG